MLLSDDERRRFADYCEQQAESARQVINQFSLMPSMGQEVIDAMTKREKQKLAAYAIVATDLRSVESVTIR